MTNGDVFKKFMTKTDTLDLIKKGVLFHLNNDVKWEGIDSLIECLDMKQNMLYARIMNEIEGEDENDEKARQKHEESEMVRKLLAKQTEQMDVINQQRQQQQDSMNQLQYLKSQNEALMEKVDHPDQTLIEDLMKKQNESAEAFKQMMENDETAGMKAETEEMKAKQEQIYNEMMRKQKEQEDHIAKLMKKLEKEKNQKGSEDEKNKSAIEKLQGQLKNVSTANSIIKNGFANKFKKPVAKTSNPKQPDLTPKQTVKDSKKISVDLKVDLKKSVDAKIAESNNKFYDDMIAKQKQQEELIQKLMKKLDEDNSSAMANKLKDQESATQEMIKNLKPTDDGSGEKIAELTKTLAMIAEQNKIIKDKEQENQNQKLEMQKQLDLIKDENKILMSAKITAEDDNQTNTNKFIKNSLQQNLFSAMSQKLLDQESATQEMLKNIKPTDDGSGEKIAELTKQLQMIADQNKMIKDNMEEKDKLIAEQNKMMKDNIDDKDNQISALNENLITSTQEKTSIGGGVKMAKKRVDDLERENKLI